MPLNRFRLPPKGTLIPSNSDDPLRYYYLPLVGRLYVSRINIATGLIQNQFFEKTLEIGYGSGVLIPTLSKISDEVYGVDLQSNPETVSQLLAKLDCYPKLSYGVPDRLLFDDNTFDLIVAISVLEHIKEIRSFLEEIHRVLKPGGQLLVGMPAVNKFMDYLFQAIGFSGIEAHHVMSPEEMSLASQGLFKLEKSAHMPGFLPSNTYLYKSFCFRK
ncbi:MAG: class I SAM-dependent methyltransferase [Leptolyngbya sp. SIO1D8]|nr:class I SAM-dependent methyltransferase [Leptolyngbya sp. SIO1D8]